MFTGLVEGIGVIKRIDLKGVDRRIYVQPGFDMDGVEIGESISVDGACLTVTEWDGSMFSADVSAETLSRTTLGSKKIGDKVNLERALRVGDRLGGHVVLGHVDCVGTLKRRYTEGSSIRLVFEIPEKLTKYIIEKGSIAINGVSLTVNSVKSNTFDINIIPHTAEITTIGALRAGDKVNIEVDVIGKYVEKMLGSWKESSVSENTSITQEMLKKYGFM